MADISAVFVSIDMYSSTLEKLIKLTDKAVDKLINATSNTKKAVDNMKVASFIADEAAAKMQKSTSALNTMVTKMDRVSSSTVKATKKLKDAGASTGKIVTKLDTVGSSTSKAVTKMLKAGTTVDKVTKKMHNSESSVGKMIDKIQKAGKATGKIVDKFQDAGNQVDKTADKLDVASDKVKTASENINKASNAMEGLNNKADKAKDSGGGLGKIFGSIFNLDNMQKGMKLVDDLARSNTKLNSINDGNQTPADLQDKIYAASGNSRSSYSNMVGSVTKLESTTGDLFKTNDETIAFTELAQKSFVAGGGNQEERSASMDQLTDSMAGGGIKGDDLTALSQTAPAIVAAISSYTGKTGKDLKDLADKGKITSDIIKNSMFAAGDQINSSFANTPMTFEDIWTRIQDSGLQAFSGIMEKITEFVSNPEFGQFINGLVLGINMLVDGVSWLIGLIAGGWGIIGPILAVIGTVLLIQMIAGLWAMVPPVIAQAIAWLTASIPLLIFIGLIVMAIAVAISMGASFQEIFGFIGGVIGGLGTAFNNVFNFIWNVVADFVNFFGNALNDPITSMKILFSDFAIDVIGLVENMVIGIESLINRIPLVKINISDGITDFKNKLIDQTEKLKTESDYKIFMDHKEYEDIAAGFDKGKSTADDLYNKTKTKLDDMKIPAAEPFSGFPDGLPDGAPGGQSPFDPSQITPSNPLPVEGTGPNGSVNVEMPEDDLDYLREIAERDYIANVATNSLAPNISIQFGDVHENADANKIAGRIREILQNEIAVASEGVY